MFRHLTGNDPRPHFFHQSNLADYNPALPAVHPARAASCTRSSTRSWTATRRPSTARARRCVQLTSAQIAETLARQEAWAAGAGRGDARGSRTVAYTYATAAPRR